MKRRRHTPEQTVRKLREAERLLGEGQTIAEAAKQVEIPEQTYHRWRNQYGGMQADDARRLRELERENARLKRIVAGKELDIDALRTALRACCRTAFSRPCPPPLGVPPGVGDRPRGRGDTPQAARGGLGREPQAGATAPA